MLILILLPVTFLLPPGAGAGEIIGGREARPHSRPYMAYLEIQRGKSSFVCGGFLVSENFVLTAAHCKEGKITVYLGAHNIKNKQEQSRQVIPTRVKIPHPEYDEETDNNDIMLLQLKRKAELTQWVKTIPLPRADKKLKPRTKCSVAGWGWTSAKRNKTSDTLQEVDVVVMRDDACSYSDYNSYTMLCAGVSSKDKNPSQGDSGGPLVCRGTAQGIVSYGSGDGDPPAVYTRVSTFVPWIQEEIKKLQP
ncbi:mast cell protease 1A-like [Emydura macquarii macquarii]|uniref:mast cell protease 1A-like n=1 Tax=Emydura macquarii macquarii TaxID=1129001 RepID=UPI00352A6CA4